MNPDELSARLHGRPEFDAKTCAVKSAQDWPAAFAYSGWLPSATSSAGQVSAPPASDGASSPCGSEMRSTDTTLPPSAVLEYGDALRRATGDTNIANRNADHLAAIRHKHDLVIVGDGKRSDKRSDLGSLGHVRRANALAAAVGETEVVRRRALAIAEFRHRQDKLLATLQRVVALRRRALPCRFHSSPTSVTSSTSVAVVPSSERARRSAVALLR